MNEIKKAAFLLGLFLIVANMMFAGGSYAAGPYSDELAARNKYYLMPANSPTNASFVGAWQWNYGSGYQILVFTQDGTGLFQGYDKNGYKSIDGPSTFNYRSSTNEIVLYFPALYIYRHYTYSFSSSNGFRFTFSHSGSTINHDYIKLDLDTFIPPTPPPLPPAVSYTVAIGNQQYGPYGMEQLRQMVQLGTLTRDTLVWREGMAQWTAAGTVQDLAGLFSSAPPPLPEPSLIPLPRPLPPPPRTP